MDITLDIARCMSEAVGPEHGITQRELDEVQPKIDAAHDRLRQERAERKYGFYDLYKEEAMFRDVHETAAAFLAREYENLVVLGIGGSALSTTALATALKPPYYESVGRRAKGTAPRLFVMDNIDPVTFNRMLRVCSPKKTMYYVVSKSGETAETLTQLLLVVDAIDKELGRDAIKDHIVAATNPPVPGKANPVRTIAEQLGMKTFEIPLNVGGRFSAFCPVGMFPAALLGINLDELRAGCEAMDARCVTPNLKDNPAYLFAAVHHLACQQKGKSMTVMMPYADALRDLADWYRQLWAESLGKRFSLDGAEVFAGQTPIKALGVTDQHSQVQLYREGPNDKIITVLEVVRFDKTLKIPNALPEIGALDYLIGKTMNKLIEAELYGTIDALKISLRPVVHIALPRVNAHTVAQLMYMLEVATAMAGRLLNVQTFDQPGVEEGKRIARELMGKAE